MAPKRIEAGDIAGHLPAGGAVWLAGCSADSALVRSGLEQANLSKFLFQGIYVPGLNRLDWLVAARARIRTWFMLPELAKSAPGQIDFRPLPYREIRRQTSVEAPGAMVVMLAPPDRDGLCSFGTVTDFAADIWQSGRTIIAHINPLMPATRGTPGIPFDRLTAYVEGEEELRASDPGMDDASRRIAGLCAQIIPDGATVQAGLGRTPEAVLRGLTGHRGLAIHSGLIGDSTLALLEAGALRNERPITAGVAIGTRKLYDAAAGEAFAFRPPSHTHELRMLAGIERFVTVNSAIEVDMIGQAYAEATPRGPLSGPGGASDFAAGARASGGLRIVVLPATAQEGAISRIVPEGKGTGPVSLGRFDTDIVVTEFGVADLRSLSDDGRRAAIAAIAASAHRGSLT